ncbi:MCE family protein [Amycolatopsis sp. K13G38]|uniref:MCE family protein n=1 Tax=Amycolatopsis acididurans TaxID=2724524 RepID=A0ABX1JDC6_9PSEU|nr:MlaD family protein [Amycolatopsis acididurans]NKQ57738.1 MCE family protein [Amycolatopsis acididurans]
MTRNRARRATRTRLLAVAVVALVSVTAATTGIAARNSGSGITIVAQFADASPLLVGNDVKANGVTIGHVAAMNVVNGRLAGVALTLDRSALPVHVDARVTIKPVSLLGERYVDLERGSAAAPEIGDGGLLPANQTGTEPDLYQVLNTVDQPTGSALSALVTMLGEGMRGNGSDAAATIGVLQSAMRDTDGLARLLDQQNDVLNSLVERLQPVASALADDNGRTLDGLINSARQLTSTAAADHQQLEQSLAELPATFNQARATLAQLTGTANATVPTLAAIRPTTDQLTAISQELGTFADAADPALASARPVLEHARELLAQAGPVADELRMAAPSLRSVAANARPLVTSLTANLGTVLDFVRNWALTTNGHDGVSHYFRAMVTINPDAVTGLLPGGAPNAAPSPAPGPGAAAPPAPPNGLLAPQSSDGSATGLTQNQESGALQLLLGGGQ